jgi:hypothetical protein
LQVGTVINVDEFGGQNTPTWLAEHPHVAHAGRFAGQRNTIYVAADRLQLGRNSVARAAGMFSRWSPALKLTAEGRSRSVWQVPIWFEPCEERPALTYHGHPDRWTRQGRNLYLKSVAKGQEFVLNAAHYPEAVEWASSLIKEHA